MKSIKPAIGVILIFLLGALSGSATTFLVYRADCEVTPNTSHHSREAMLLKRLSDGLALDNRQQDQIGTIIHETHGKISRIRQKMRPEIEAVLAESQQRISVLLRPDQLDKFRKIIEEHRAHRRMEHR